MNAVLIISLHYSKLSLKFTLLVSSKFYQRIFCQKPMFVYLNTNKLF